MAKPKAKPAPKKPRTKNATAAPAPASSVGSHFLRRADVARALGVTVTQVRRLQASGELKATPDKEGVFRFDPVDVKAQRDKRAPKREGDGAMAAKAFALFEAGRAMHEVVVELELAPALALKLQEQWRDSRKGGWWLSERLVLMLRERGLQNPAAIVDLIDQKIARVRALKFELERLQLLASAPSPSSHGTAPREAL